MKLWFTTVGLQGFSFLFLTVKVRELKQEMETRSESFLRNGNNSQWVNFRGCR